MAEEIETRPTITSPTPTSPLIIARLTDGATVSVEEKVEYRVEWKIGRLDRIYRV